MNEGPGARRYLRAHRHGVLATISKKIAGYPFGSLLPFMLDHSAQPVVLVSQLAEHTKNIAADPRVSLLVHEPAADIQAAARLTLIGDAARVGDGLDLMHERYLNYYPDAERLFALGDFSFYRIAPVMLRFIGGFGAVCWISAASFAPPPNSLAEHEADIVAHLNAEHAHNLRDYCRHFRQMAVRHVTVVGIDCDGFDARADGVLLRFDFEQPVADAAAARQALAAMAHQARGQ